MALMPKCFRVTAIIAFVLVFSQTSAQFAAECGSRYRSRDSYIVNGTEARSYEFPWHVSLQRYHVFRSGGRRVNYCGGSIISNFWVLTAGHCFWDLNRIIRQDEPNKWYILAGTSIMGTKSQHTWRVACILTQQDYFNSSNLEWRDIALVRALRRFEFMSRLVIPICLRTFARPNLSDFDTTQCVAPGWGKLGLKSPQPTNLNYAKLPILDWSECREIIGTGDDGTFPRKHTCGGGREIHSAICFGDSGGALACPSKRDSAYYLVGITVKGFSCNFNISVSRPSVFEDVLEHLDWIEEVISRDG